LCPFFFVLCGETHVIFYIQKQSMSAKHLLFYSNYCGHCKDLLTEIVKRGIRPKFLLICVEKHRVPPIVDRVPFIMTSDKKIVLENNINMFIQSLVQTSVNTSAHAANNTQMNDDIVAYSPSPRNHFGSEYCMIDENNEMTTMNNTSKKRNGISEVLGYVFLDEQDDGDQERTHRAFENAQANGNTAPITNAPVYSSSVPSQVSQSSPSSFIGSPAADAFSPSYVPQKITQLSSTSPRMPNPMQNPNYTNPNAGIFPTMQSSSSAMTAPTYNAPTYNAPIYNPDPFQTPMAQPNAATPLPFKQISMAKGPKTDDSIYDQLLKKRAEEESMLKSQNPFPF